jgi:translation initiation factor 1
MRLETSGRGGKAVTVLFHLPFEEQEARDLLKSMQASFGCGGAIKDQTLELRGDVRAKVEAFFAKKNLKVVRAGG